MRSAIGSTVITHQNSSGGFLRITRLVGNTSIIAASTSQSKNYGVRFVSSADAMTKRNDDGASAPNPK